MRIAIAALILSTGCTHGANHLGNPLLLPFNGLATLAENTVYNQRRGKVEVFVKTNHPALIAQIAAGGGLELTQAMDHANIITQDRPARIIQMQSDLPLYRVNLGALVTALMVYGNQ